MLCNTDVGQFRATITPVVQYKPATNELYIPADMADALGLFSGGDVRFIAV